MHNDNAGVHAYHRSMTISARDRFLQAMALLDGCYGRPVWEPRYAPVDELVYTVLSQNTADVNTVRSFEALSARFADWSAVRDAPVDEIEATIARSGLAHVKAPRIKTILAALSERSGVPCLDELSAMDDAAALAYLEQLPGVGPKTAACVLLFALGRAAMPVDTHVHRVAARLGVIDARLSAEAAHGLLTELAGPENVYALHVNLVLHGRRVCHARRPACLTCALREMCPSASQVIHDH